MACPYKINTFSNKASTGYLSAWMQVKPVWVSCLIMTLTHNTEFWKFQDLLSKHEYIHKKLIDYHKVVVLLPSYQSTASQPQSNH